MIDCKFEDGADANLRHCVVDSLVFNNDKTQILLVKRGQKLLTGAGLWALPGGYVDLNERVIEAAAREVKEETGYDVGQIKLIKVNDNPNRKGEDRQNIAFVYRAVAGEKTGEPDDESEEVKWFELSNLPKEAEFAFDHFEIIMGSL